MSRRRPRPAPGRLSAARPAEGPPLGCTGSTLSVLELTALGTAQDPMQLMTAGAQAFAGFDLSLANRLARAAFDAGGGFAAAELLSTMLMFGDQQNDALIGRLDEEDPQQTVAERLVELAATLDGGLPSIMSLHATAAARDSGADLLAVADAFKAKGLWLYAAEAAAAARRLREGRTTPWAGAADRLLTDMLNLCDLLRTPALGMSRPALNDRERQIARMAAAGVSSRQIATELYLSTRTVENHLRRVYAKLGVIDHNQTDDRDRQASAEIFEA